MRSAVRAVRSVWAYLNAILDGDKYRNYLAFHAREHPDREPMTEGEYWRARYAHEDEHPEGRCC